MRLLSSRNLVFFVVTLALMPLRCDADEKKQSKSDRTVTVDFGDRALGGLYLCHSDYPVETKSLKMTALAKGRLSLKVPPLFDLVLVANATAIKQPALLKSIPPNALDVLIINAVSLDEEEDKLSDNILSSIGGLTGLKELFIPQIGVSDAGLRKIKACTNLVYLCVSNSNITGSCFKDLAALAQLSIFDLSANAIKPEYLDSLAQFQRLRVLKLDKTNLDVRGVEKLTKCSGVSELIISSNPKVNDQCSKYLAQMKKLKSIDLTETSLTMTGISQLTCLKNLRMMKLSRNRFSSEQRESIRKLFPRVSIFYVASSKPVTDDLKAIYAPVTR